MLVQPTHQLQIIAVQSFGFINGPEDVSDGAMGSRLRILRGIEKARLLARGGDVWFYFPQGFQKQDPREPIDTDVSLGESLARYVESVLTEEDRKRIHVRFEPLSFGTDNDIKAIREMLRPGEVDEENPPYIHFVTDAAHMRRVRLVWRFVGFPGWSAAFCVAKQHKMSRMDRLKEPLKWLGYRYRFWRQR